MSSARLFAVSAPATSCVQDRPNRAKLTRTPLTLTFDLFIGAIGAAIVTTFGRRRSSPSPARCFAASGSTMRQPTDRRELYRWWSDTLKAIGQFRTIARGDRSRRNGPAAPDHPQCGFYKRRMKVGGNFVEARIFLEQQLSPNGELAADEVLKCQIGEDFYDPADQWLYLANRPITQEEYRFGVGHRRYESEQSRHVPDPEISVDFMTAPPPMFKTKNRGLHMADDTPEKVRAGIGHNAPPEPLEAFDPKPLAEAPFLERLRARVTPVIRPFSIEWSN
jgi:hypothetical protein